MKLSWQANLNPTCFRVVPSGTPARVTLRVLCCALVMSCRLAMPALLPRVLALLFAPAKLRGDTFGFTQMYDSRVSSPVIFPGCPNGRAGRRGECRGTGRAANRVRPAAQRSKHAARAASHRGV
jgi:hypothetical protein